MPSMSKLSRHATTWEIRNTPKGTAGSVIYHHTRVVSWEPGTLTGWPRVTLNSGGYKTVTTKCRMVQASNQFGLKYTVFQRDGEWFVDVMNPAYTTSRLLPGAEDQPYWRGLRIPFVDGMTFDTRHPGA
jgi:hypothetical protein